MPGDSARIIVNDPITAVVGTNPSGLDTDDLGGTGNQSGTNGNKACYLYVHVIDSGVPSPTKTGAVLSGGPQYPFKDTIVADNKTWTRIQCWLRVLSNNTFVVDLNDNLFEAGDVIEFFFGATNTNGQTSYCSGPSFNYVQSDVDLAAEIAAEFSILPVNGGDDDRHSLRRRHGRTRRASLLGHRVRTTRDHARPLRRARAVVERVESTQLSREERRESA